MQAHSLLSFLSGNVDHLSYNHHTPHIGNQLYVGSGPSCNSLSLSDWDPNQRKPVDARISGCLPDEAKPALRSKLHEGWSRASELRVVTKLV